MRVMLPKNGAIWWIRSLSR